MELNIRPSFRLTQSLIVAAWCWSWIAVSHTAAQSTQPPKSTMSGVYTEQQAAKGEETYMNFCVGCHAAGSYASKDFAMEWEQRPVAELFDLLATKMPKGDPGSLTRREYTDVVAYMLKINKVPSGSVALPEDYASLAKILMAFPAK
jgi:mono/diheme cytochrome c family protein